MKNQTRLFALLLAIVASLLVGAMPKVAAQDDEPKQTLRIYYPAEGIVLEGKGEDAVMYKGVIYVKVYPITPRLKKKFGDGPIYSNETSPLANNSYDSHLPLGEYEVHFQMRVGTEMRTCIKKQVILRPDDLTRITAEMSNVKTLVIGGTMTAQQMQDTILKLQAEVEALKAEIDELKKKAK